MSDCKNSENLLNTKPSSTYQSCDRRTPQINRNTKRVKRAIKKSKNSVTFAMEDIYIDGCNPYESGITDADVIRLYHRDIWYTKTDYDSFMQDRNDTIRVYRSVKGNMSGLHDYYCIHGLEKFLAVDQPMKVGQKLRGSIISALPTHFVDLSHQTMLSSSNCTSLLTIYNVMNLNNAIATLRQSNEPGFLDKQIKRVLTSTDENDSTLHGSAENIEVYVDNNRNRKAIDNFGVPVPTAIRKNIFAVDVKSLRVLNMKLLKSMCTNSPLSAMSLSNKAEAELRTSNSLLYSRNDITERVAIERTPIPLECNTLQSISYIGNTEYNATIMNVMNRALEITSSCVDPTMSSNQLIEIPRTKTSHCAYDCISHLT